MDQTDFVEASQKEAVLMAGMMMLVMEGNSLREIANNPYALTQLAERVPAYRDSGLVTTLLYSAERFEQLIREGSKTLEALKMLRTEGVMERYTQSIFSNGQEMH